MGKKVLVIDDESAILTFMQRVVSGMGIDVTVTQNADDALQMIADESYHLVITDLNMPGISGEELCRRIRLIDSGVIVYAFSGFLADYSTATLEEAAFDGHIKKPGRPEILRKAIRGALSRA